MRAGRCLPRARPPGRGARGAAAAPRWRALVVALLLAFSWQGFVTQTHLHAPAEAGAAPAAPGTLATPRHRRPDPPASCPICRDIAHAGRFVLPPAIRWHRPEPSAAWLAAPLPVRWTRPSRSHAWLSRGPPAPSAP